MTFIFRDRNIESIEFQLKKAQLDSLVEQFNAAIAKLDAVSFMPRKNLFILKQHYLPKPAPPLVRDFSDLKLKHQMQRQGTLIQKQKLIRPMTKQGDFTETEHVIRRAGLADKGMIGPSGQNEGFACLKFDVIMTNPDDTNLIKNYVICRELYMSQNQQTLVTELRLSDDTRVFGLKGASVDGALDGNSRLVRMALINSEEYAESLPWTVEFTSQFKVFQFMQLRQLFRTRQACKLRTAVPLWQACQSLVPDDVMQLLS